MTGRRRRIVAFVGGVTTALGIAGFVAAGHVAFDDRRGWPLWHILHFNRLGAAVTIGLLALAAAIAGSRTLLVAVGIGFALCWVATLLFTGGADNVLGGRGDTLSFFLASALGLLTLALAPDVAKEGSSEFEEARISSRQEPLRTDSPGP
jgi:hypothetical protein